MQQQIFVKGEDQTDQIRSWQKNGSKIDITYNGGKTYSFNAENVRIVDSALAEPTAKTRFEYLFSIAHAVGLKDPEGRNILANRYAKINFVSQDSMLSAFLTGQLNLSKNKNIGNIVYPFGFNISQKKAADYALTAPLSIIEGPPGTGKTQTILNIIANAVMRGESIAVVSSNNSATANIREKLKKYKVDFIAAYLGNTDNKREFIETQKPLPDLSSWKLSPKRSAEVYNSLHKLFALLNEMLDKKNKLSRHKQEKEGIELEFKYFDEYFRKSGAPKNYQFKKKIKTPKILELWLLCERYAKTDKKMGLITRIYNRLKYGIIDKTFYSLSPEIMIAVTQNYYYETRLNELREAISVLEKALSSFNFDKKMEEYSELSAVVFKDKLADKYGKSERERFTLDDLWKNAAQFIAAYPVVLSTTYSLRSSLSYKVMYDYVVIDESSQVDIATGALALSCARKAVIVGDLKQLPHVVDNETAKATDLIFSQFNIKFNIPGSYRYKNHSLLSAVTELFPSSPQTLLEEHYRCHPKIIEFCNQKFYRGKLIILTEPSSKREPLVVYKTVEGNHARDHVNKRQIDVIIKEVIPQQNLDPERDSIGIVTPYRNQTSALQNAFFGTAVKADTVDKFQGRENDVIILSTVDNTASEFTDNANRLNVAVSRAVEQLIVVVSAEDTERDTNIGDLVRYIRYNNMEVIQSRIYSVFDYLYSGYKEKLSRLLDKHGRVSEYDSENLIFKLIKDVLKGDDAFTKYEVVFRVPLKIIIRDFSLIDREETDYAMNILTHVDFLIFDKLGKTPRLVVEVDGASYHKQGTPQFERDRLKDRILEKYGLEYIRLRTDESGEREQLINALKKHC